MAEQLGQAEPKVYVRVTKVGGDPNAKAEWHRALPGVTIADVSRVLLAEFGTAEQKAKAGTES